jgi:hypothetical protein
MFQGHFGGGDGRQAMPAIEFLSQHGRPGDLGVGAREGKGVIHGAFSIGLRGYDLGV